MSFKCGKIVLLCLLITFVTCFNYVFAENFPAKVMINKENVEAKLEPSNSSASLEINNVTIKLPKDSLYNVTEEIKDQDNIVTWYKIVYTQQQTSYDVYVSVNDIYYFESEFEAMLESGFPETYQQKLRLLHIAHPTWQFVAYDTNIEWATMISKQSSLRKSLINGSNIALRSTAEGCFDPITQTFIALDGTSWYQANYETISYYVDPRNFLNETNVFMFLDISYKGTETVEQIQGILNNTFMAGSDPVDNISYAQIFYDAGQLSLVSPVYLAVLAIQEQGVNGSSAITGNTFTYNGKTYSSLYNFFNIGATSSAENWKKGLVYANGGENGESTTYSRPWNTPVKAIRGGASWIGNGYISKGQDTMYYKKFNCTTYSTFSHQYMTNVRAPYSQSTTLYNSYRNSSSLETNLVFEIPVYKNMPAYTELPTTIELPPPPPDEDDPSAGDLIVDLDLANEDGYLSGFQLGTTYADLKTRVSIIDNTVTIKLLKNNKELSDSALISTGTVINIIDTNGTSTYSIVVKGDINGDGLINTKDYLMYRKALLGTYTFNTIENKAAKVNGMNEISTKGYLIFTKYLLGTIEIEP